MVYRGAKSMHLLLLLPSNIWWMADIGERCIYGKLTRQEIRSGPFFGGSSLRRCYIKPGYYIYRRGTLYIHVYETSSTIFTLQQNEHSLGLQEWMSSATRLLRMICSNTNDTCVWRITLELRLRYKISVMLNCSKFVSESGEQE